MTAPRAAPTPTWSIKPFADRQLAPRPRGRCRCAEDRRRAVGARGDDDRSGAQLAPPRGAPTARLVLEQHAVGDRVGQDRQVLGARGPGRRRRRPVCQRTPSSDVHRMDDRASSPPASRKARCQGVSSSSASTWPRSVSVGTAQIGRERFVATSRRPTSRSRRARPRAARRRCAPSSRPGSWPAHCERSSSSARVQRCDSSASQRGVEDVREASGPPRGARSPGRPRRGRRRDQGSRSAAPRARSRPRRRRGSGRRRSTVEPFRGEANTPERGEVPLPLEDLRRLPVHIRGLVAPAGERDHLGQVAERVAVGVEQVGALGERDRLARQRLGLGRARRGARGSWPGRCATAPGRRRRREPWPLRSCG